MGVATGAFTGRPLAVGAVYDVVCQEVHCTCCNIRRTAAMGQVAIFSVVNGLARQDLLCGISA